MASNIVIFDTSVLIDHLRTGKHKKRLEQLNAIIRNSAVVVSELFRGATKKEELAFVKNLAENHPVLTPTEKNWIESGVMLAAINKSKEYTPGKLRDLHFDILIALTARNSGATVITSNKADFHLIQKHKDFKLELW